MIAHNIYEPLRIGIIDSILAYPLFFPLQTKIIPSTCTFYVAPPMQVNQKLSKKELDIALVSSSSYIDNRNSYILLSDYGLATKDRIENVCLFCRTPAFDFSRASSFLVPPECDATIRLLRVLSKHFWKSHATFTETNAPLEKLLEQDLPFLLFGDQCLQLRESSLSSCDLALEWNSHTNMGFVFSLIATRNDVLSTRTEEVFEFHKSLVESFHWSTCHKQKILRAAEKKLSLPPAQIEQYFQNLDYEILQDYIDSLDHFVSFAI